MYFDLLKKFSFISIMCSLILTNSCNPFNPEKRTERTEAYQNSDLKNNEIVSGENYVFEYSLAVDPIPGAIDDEYTDYLLFAINKNEAENFKFENENLSKINASSRRSCFCFNRDYQKITKGTINGRRLNNNTWKIDGIYEKLISSTGKPEQINFSTEFKLKN